ncbi:aminotransferase class IV [Micromonospora sp. NBS 11-29]|uniref:aminotransferase class IV n=1 Tax=Micromonospora sp. NBS 11-29 TaxID=1960879 RepID=UPI000B79201A|nr:aminotransferase class IV [Micromonospora sp. NBS 11-29]
MTAQGSSLRTVWDPAGPAGLPFGSNSMQHGTAVFEGIRCYATSRGPAVFRLDDHLARLLASARQLGVPHDYDLPRLRERVLAAARAGGPDEVYLRPVLHTPDERLGIDLARFRFVLAVEVYAMAGEPATTTLPAGVRLTVSPWRRPAATSFPPQVKATGTYVVSALARTAAVAAGHDDAIQLDPVSGRVAEATVANVFLVRDGRLLTPWLADGLLAGITRDTVLVLARRLGIEVVEGPVEPADLSRAQEVFLTGTAAELVPASEVDGHRTDPRGPVFRAVAEAFRDTVRGRRFDDLGWLTHTSLSRHTNPV